MASWRDLLNESESPYGVAALKGDNALAEFSSPVALAKAEVSKGDMSVTCVLTTTRADRQGDIVIPAGGDFTEHRINPVVQFHHGRNGHLPIGKAEDKNGNYTVRLVKAEDGDRLVGTTYFSQSNRFANDVFGLVAEDILRGVSIGFDPKDDGAKHTKAVEIIGPSPSLERDALKFNSWTLLEYSHTPLGVNREALTVAVSKAMDGSRAIHPKLLKYLTPYASPRKTVVAVRVQPTVRKAMNPDDDDMDGDTFAQPDQAGGIGDEGGDVGVADEVPAQDAGAEAPPTPAVKTLLDGAQGLLDMSGQLKVQIKQSEHLKARKYIKEACEELEKVAADFHGFASKVQKEMESGEEAMEDDAEPEEVEDDDVEEGDDGDDEMPPKKGKKPPMEQDDDGAIVTKGYTPRRLIFADIPGLRADPAPKQTKAKTTGGELKVPKGKVIVDQTDLDSLLNEIELQNADREAAAKRRR